MDLYFDAITARILSTATWRRSLVDKFPDDTRNELAAVRLEELADTDTSQVSPDTWEKLDLENERFSQALNDSCRDIGFRSRPKDLDQFIKGVVARLEGRGAI
jgi:hypothetical protein